MVGLRIATRGSRLARWQAQHIATLLYGAHGIDTELVIVSTTGDVAPDVPIHALGGTGVFVKEVQQAVLDGHADITVHSAKDLPSETPEGLLLACIPERGDPRDALVGMRLVDVPVRGTIATGSVRRRAQLAAVRSDINFAELRGNIDTRIAKVAGSHPEFDAVVVALAALVRLELTDVIAEIMPLDVMLPQVGQGALAIECRADDRDTAALLGVIDHSASHRCVMAERAFLAAIGGGCDAPIAAHAVIDGDRIVLDAQRFDESAPDRAQSGAVMHIANAHAVGTDPDAVGRTAAEFGS